MINMSDLKIVIDKDINNNHMNDTITIDNINSDINNISGSRKVDIGLDLVANPNKISSESNTPILSPKVNIDNIETIDIDKELENFDFNNIVNDNSNNSNNNNNNDTPFNVFKDSTVEEVNIENTFNNTSNNETSNNTFNNEQTTSFNEQPTFQVPQKEESIEEKVLRIKKEKEELLMKFDRLKRLGYNIPYQFNMTSDLDSMKYEYEKLKKEKEIENSVKFSRKMLMACTTGIEFLNNKFDPFDVKLDGWSESIHENINDYDDVFTELYEKYHTTSNMAPELKLLFMVAGSGFMFHLTNTMFKSNLPNMQDILKQNPNMMNQFMNGFQQPSPPQQQQYQPPQQQYQQPPQQYQPPPQQYQSPNIQKPKQNINPPKGVDEILSELKNNRNFNDETSMESNDNRNIEIKRSKKTKNGISLNFS